MQIRKSNIKSYKLGLGFSSCNIVILLFQLPLKQDSFTEDSKNWIERMDGSPDFCALVFNI